MSETILVQSRLDIAAVIGQTFGIIGRNLSSVVVVAFTLALAGAAIDYALSFGLQSGISGISYSVLALRTFSGTLGLVLQNVAVGGITLIAVNDLNGTRTRAGSALATGFRLLFPLAGIGIVAGLGIAIGFLLLVVPGVLLWMRWFVCTPVRVVEGPTIGRALSRSAALTKGHRWRLLLLAIAFAIVGIAINFTFTWMGGVLGKGGGHEVLFVSASIAQVIASTIITSISATGVAVCYVALRRIREGVTFSDIAAVFA